MTSKRSLENYHNLKDKLLKFMFAKYGLSFLEVIGINAEIKAVCSTEIVTDDLKTHLLDLLIYTTDDELVNIEFHSSNLDEKSLARYFKYAHETYRKYRKEVKSIIILNEKIDEDYKLFEINKRQHYCFQLISLKNYNAQNIISNVKNKLINNQPISKKDIIQLTLIGFTNYQQTLEEILIKALKLLDKIIIEEEEKSYIKQIIEVLYIHLTNKDVEGELRKMLDIGSTMLAKRLNQQRKELNEEFERELEQKLEQNTEDVIKKRTSEIISKMKKNGYSNKEIFKITGTDVTQTLDSK